VITPLMTAGGQACRSLTGSAAGVADIGETGAAFAVFIKEDEVRLNIPDIFVPAVSRVNRQNMIIEILAHFLNIPIKLLFHLQFIVR
jgi:hypothetical protein